VTDWWFLLHGQSVANVAGWLSGWDDVALTPEGEQQARDAGALLADAGFRRVLVSDLQRARRTASLALGTRVVPMHVVPELRERSMGALQGAPIAEVRADGRYDRLLRGFTASPPGGESHQGILRRALAALRHWDDGTPTLVVAHGTLVKDLVAWADGVPGEELGTIPAAPNATPIHRRVAWRTVRGV
jgi:broad specificity phosphatase PhoE